jgi:type IV secretory pathway VirB2 component (pilin)
MNHRVAYRALAVGALIVLAASPAYAQIAGGGGGGLLSQVIQWFVTNIVQGLVMAAVLFCGALLMFSRHTLAGIACVVIGAIVMANYTTIAGFFGIG